MPLRIVYYLWNKLIIWNDNLFLHFLIVSLIIQNREKILSSEYSYIPNIISKLKFSTEEDIDSVIELVIDISNQTPHSFRILATKLDIFKYHSTKLKDLYKEFDPDSILAFPIFPSEILPITYKNIFGCVNSSCNNYNKHNKRNKENNNNKSRCLYCHSSFNNKDISYVILDLRLHQRDYNDCQGCLPKSIIFNEEQLLNNSFPDNIIDSLNSNKSKKHFIIMTSKTNYYKEYEQKYYNEETVKEDEKFKRFGIITKENKELNLKRVMGHIEKDKSSIFSLQIKEYDNYKKLISSLLKEKYHFISFVYGGYGSIHDECLKKNILEGHHESKCNLCDESIFGYEIIASLKYFLNMNQSKKNKISFGKKDIRLDLNAISQLISDPSVCQYSCIKKLNKEKEELLIIFLKDHQIYIYKEDIYNELLTYVLLYTITFDSIISVKERNSFGNILTLTYYSSNFQIMNGSNGNKKPESITVDFTSNVDSKDFKNKILITQRENSNHI